MSDSEEDCRVVEATTPSVSHGGAATAGRRVSTGSAGRSGLARAGGLDSGSSDSGSSSSDEEVEVVEVGRRPSAAWRREGPVRADAKCFEGDGDAGGVVDREEERRVKDALEKHARVQERLRQFRREGESESDEGEGGGEGAGRGEGVSAAAAVKAVAVKVVGGDGAVHSVSLEVGTPLAEFAGRYARAMGLSGPDAVRLYLNADLLDHCKSPEECGMVDGDELDARWDNTSATAANTAAAAAGGSSGASLPQQQGHPASDERDGGDDEQGPKVRLIVRSASGERKFSVASKKPLLRLHEAYAGQEGIEPTSRVVLKFDGEKIDPASTTPESLDMEDDDILDAIVLPLESVSKPVPPPEANRPAVTKRGGGGQGRGRGRGAKRKR